MDTVIAGTTKKEVVFTNRRVVRTNDEGQIELDVVRTDLTADGADDLGTISNTAVTAYLPAEAGYDTGPKKDHLFDIRVTDISAMTLECSLEGGTTGKWYDITIHVLNVLTAYRGATSFSSVAASTDYLLALVNWPPCFLRWKFTVPDATNAAAILESARG